MKELSIEEKAKAYDGAIERAKEQYDIYSNPVLLEYIFPELKESEDERIRKAIIEFFELQDDNATYSLIPKKDILSWLEKQSKKELVNFDEAEKEKSDFVGDGFIKCFANFLDFKEGNTYWLEYIGDDKYNVRSDNLLGKTYHITPCQLYTVFKKLTWLEKQGEKGTNGNEREIPNSAWSEEDEKIYSRIYDLIHNAAYANYDVDEDGKELGEYAKIAYWLKSLKERYTWKPSEEQMEFLWKYAEQNNYDASILTSLYNDLKKLREE